VRKWRLKTRREKNSDSGERAIWSFVVLGLLAFRIPEGLERVLERTPCMYTHAEKYLTRYAAEASAARDRSAARARVPLLLGTISNWPQATIARGGRRTRTHACRNGPLLRSWALVSETWHRDDQRSNSSAIRLLQIVTKDYLPLLLLTCLTRSILNFLWLFYVCYCWE